jgi:hypothetical protein
MPAFHMKQIHSIQTPNPAVYIRNKAFSGNGPEYFFSKGIKGTYIKIELFGDSYFFSCVLIYFLWVAWNTPD